MRGLKITTFGMLIITLNVRIVNISVFTAILVRLNNTHAFGHCVIFSGNKVTQPHPPSPKVQVHVCQCFLHHADELKL